MTGKGKSLADRLEQGLVDLLANKQSAKKLVAGLTSEKERLAALNERLEGLSQSDRRKVLDAAGLGGVSCAPRPITPLPNRPMVMPPLAPPPPPNWAKWSNMLDVELWQAVALTLNFEPEKLPIYLKAYDMLGDDPFRICPPEFIERLEIANSQGGVALPLKIVHALKARCLVHLPTFGTWAARIWPDLPSTLPQEEVNALTGKPFPKALQGAAHEASPEFQAQYEKAWHNLEAIEKLDAELKTWENCPAVKISELEAKGRMIAELKSQKAALLGEEPSGGSTASQLQSRVKPLQRFPAQEAVILEELRQLGHDPLALPKNSPGKSGVKSEVRARLQRNPLFQGVKVFDKAWERLTDQADISFRTK